MMVGHPEFETISSRIIRMKPNPYDKATIVSAYPRAIDIVKHTLVPGRFVIPAAKDNSFSILVVGPSSWFRDVDPDGKQPLLEIPTPSTMMANSIITDWANGLPQCDMADKMPALFYVPGAFTDKTILDYVDAETKKPFKKLLEEAVGRQNNWYRGLIEEADILWARTNGNPVSISDLARIAAEKLNVAKNKSWMQDFATFEMENCPACGHLVNKLFPLCPNCKFVINKEKAKSLGISA